MDYVLLGQRIRKQRRIPPKQTQEALAEKSGISVSFLGHIERGSRKASVETLVSICNALKISPNYLLADSLDYEDQTSIAFMNDLSPRRRELVRRIAQIMAEDVVEDTKAASTSFADE